MLLQSNNLKYQTEYSRNLSLHDSYKRITNVLDEINFKLEHQPSKELLDHQYQALKFQRELSKEISSSNKIIRKCIDINNREFMEN